MPFSSNGSTGGKLPRRRAMQGLAMFGGGLLQPRLSSAVAPAGSRTGMGLVVYVRSLRRRWEMNRSPKIDLFEPFRFLEHCRESGAGGMQVALGAMESSDAARLRDASQKYEMFIDAIISPPRDVGDLARFAAEVSAAAAVGAVAARTVIMPGRRYERFKSYAEFQEYERRGRRMLELAAPVVEKHRVALAVENHKDQRIDERVKLLEGLSSEFIGACVDTGNSLALLDDANETVAALAPFAKTVHIKDQAVASYEDGFLLGDIALGKGGLDLPQMVKVLREAKSDIRFSLELITRDPLKVPCLTEGYWATMPHVPAVTLARAMRSVRRSGLEALPSISHLSLDQQVQIEDANVAASLAYARDVLEL